MGKYPIFLIILSLAGCAAQTSRNPGDPNAEFLAAVRERLIEVRDMESLNEIPIVFKSRDRAASALRERFREASGRSTLQDTSVAYAKLGLLPPGVDLSDNLLSFYSTQAMAFYDSGNKRVVLPVSNDDSVEMRFLRERDEKIIAHELVHAYQDQRFSIGERLAAAGNGDAALALRAVAEGDAVFSEYAYMFGHLDDGLPGYVKQRLAAAGEDATFLDIPMIVSDRMRFQYFAGVRFVAHVLARGGWPAVNAVYRSPPLSSEQILHPEKYFEVPDPPMRIELRNLSRLFPPPWTEIENDTLGELSVRCLFSQFLDGSLATSVARGWGGDRFVAYKKGDEVAFIWMTIWDSKPDADEFYERYKELLTIKYGPPSQEPNYYIENRGLAVVVVEGIDRRAVSEQIDTLWADMVVEETPFDPPVLTAVKAVR